MKIATPLVLGLTFSMNTLGKHQPSGFILCCFGEGARVALLQGMQDLSSSPDLVPALLASMVEARSLNHRTTSPQIR